MKSIKIFIRLFFIFAVLLSFTAAAQENKASGKAQKKTEKKKSQQLEKERKAEIKGKKFHYKIQDKATRKRMKKHRRHVDRTSYPG